VRLSLEGDAIRELLGSNGWPCDRITKDTWRSHFRGKRSSFPFYVRLDPAGFITFTVMPFVRSPQDPTKAGALYEALLRLNHSLVMAKFSIDDDLDVILSVEHPVATLDRSEFDDALDVLAYYSDLHYDELSRLARA
jgi:hypothetical protein